MNDKIKEIRKLLEKIKSMKRPFNEWHTIIPMEQTKEVLSIVDQILALLPKDESCKNPNCGEIQYETNDGIGGMFVELNNMREPCPDCAEKPDCQEQDEKPDIYKNIQQAIDKYDGNKKPEPMEFVAMCEQMVGELRLSIKAEIATDADTENALDNLERACTIIKQLQAKLEAAEKDKNDLAMLLGRYGRHDPSCPLGGKYIGGKNCNCGYSQWKQTLKGE